MKTDILILGAGIGGYETFRSLTKRLKRNGIKKTIMLVDQHNYFTFTPMLHEAATGSVEPDHCAIPIRELIHKTPHRFLKARVEKILPLNRLVKTSDGTIEYEYCVVALGSSVNYFKTKGASLYAHHVRTLPAALRLQREFIGELENSIPKIYLTIVGGGVTGVEVAGQFADLMKKEIKKLYPEKKISLRLVQSSPTILPLLPKRIQTKFTARLKYDGVRIMINSHVKEVGEDFVLLDSGKKLPSHFTIWTTGFGNLAPCFLSDEHCEAGRIPVNHHLHHPKDPHLYAVGDIALILDSETKSPYPQLGEAAHKEGQYVARHIVAEIMGRQIRPFFFRSLGTLMPLGNWYGVALIKSFIFFGPVAWWLRRTAYLLFIPGWLRKLKIVIDWTLHSFGHRYIIEVEEE